MYAVRYVAFPTIPTERGQLDAFDLAIRQLPTTKLKAIAIKFKKNTAHCETRKDFVDVLDTMTKAQRLPAIEDRARSWLGFYSRLAFPTRYPPTDTIKTFVVSNRIDDRPPTVPYFQRAGKYRQKQIGGSQGKKNYKHDSSASIPLNTERCPSRV